MGAGSIKAKGDEMKSEFLFVIDTDKYAGNFERELCGYITGTHGGTHGDKEAELFHAEETIEFNNVVCIQNEHGGSEPSTIWETPGWFNTGMGRYYRESDTDIEKQLKEYRDAVTEYHMPHIQRIESIIKQLESGKEISGWTIAGAKREICRHQESIDEANNLKAPHKYTAYNSVGVWFSSAPSKEQVETMKRRTKVWAASQELNKQGREVKIDVFRLIRFETKRHVESL